MSEPDSNPLASQASSDDTLALNLGHGLYLTLERNELVIEDRRLAKRDRARYCGVFFGGSPAMMTFPYYNILWASANKELVINFADTRLKNKPRPAKLTYNLAHTSIAAARAWVELLLSRAYDQSQQIRRAKVFINPHAGPGNAARLWETEVRPLLEAAKMSLEVVITSRGGEATEICKTLDLEGFDSVIVCSGDGLVHEVFNGLGQRPDARKALRKIAVAHIPCGSGNAMSCNLNGSYLPGPSAMAILKGRRTHVDLMSVTQGSTRLLSFLSQSAGIIAESDLATEHMRWLGAKRFDLGVAQRIFSKKVYPCDISVKTEIEGKDQVKAHYKRIHTSGENGQEVAKSTTTGTSSSSTLLDSLSTGDSDPDMGQGLPPLRFGTVNDEVPGDWQTASYDNLGNFYCGNMAWMAPNANFFPAACINDGLMDIVTNDGNLAPLKYLELMTSVESGKFFDNPLVSYRKVVAYRFTPRNQTDGYISIDGERIPFAPFQVEVHPGLGTVLAKSGKYEAAGPQGWENSA